MQRPADISAHNKIKALDRKVEFMCIHNKKLRRYAEPPRIFTRMLEHTFRTVNTGNAVPLLTENTGEKARTSTNIQNVERLPCGKM